MGAFFVGGGFGLLEFHAALVDCCLAAGGLVDFGVDAEVFAGAEGDLFCFFGCWIAGVFGPFGG